MMMIPVIPKLVTKSLVCDFLWVNNGSLPLIFLFLFESQQPLFSAMPRLWKKLPKKTSPTCRDESLSLSSHLSLTGSSSSSSPLSLCITPSQFHYAWLHFSFTMHHSISVSLCMTPSQFHSRPGLEKPSFFRKSF